MEIKVEGDPRNVVHENLVLISGESPDKAYEKALEIGKRSETSYQNPSGALVQIIFRGLADLDEMYEDLEDGAELKFRYRVDVPDHVVSSMIRPKERLRAFLPPQRAQGPDYASADVVAEVERQLGIGRPGDPEQPA